jgi:hypothetical protein
LRTILVSVTRRSRLAKHSPTRTAAEDGLTVRRIEPRPDAQTFHQIRIGDERPAEGDHVGMVQTARGQHKSQIITIVGNKGFGVGLDRALAHRQHAICAQAVSAFRGAGFVWLPFTFCR